MDEGVNAYIVSQLEEWNNIFNTHFAKSGKYFMTNMSEWQEMWSMYVEAMERHADALAQCPGGDATIMSIVEQLRNKMQFITMDHQDFHIAPPFPIVTRSVVPMLVESLKEISGALHEVRAHINPCESKWFDFVHIF
jgi:hypothetical protein